MAFCRKCGAKLEEGARFCRVCGTPVEGSSVLPQPARAAPQRNLLWPIAIALIVILLIAFFVAVLNVLPIQTINFSQTNEASRLPGINVINLNLEADIADVNVILTDLSGQLVRIDTTASGSAGILGSAVHPVQIVLTNQTVGTAMTVTGRVSRVGGPFSFNLKVVCNVYIDRSETLNVNVGTTVGKISMNANGPLTFQSINLHSTTGSTDVSLNNRVILNQDALISTRTGSVQFSWDNAALSKNILINVETTTGNVNAQVNQNRAISGNVSLSCRTTTGSVDFTMNIEGNIAAMITSQTNFGSISNDLRSFNGNKSPIYSSNYPATSNFQCNLGTTTGSIHVNAIYSNSVQGSTA